LHELGAELKDAERLRGWNNGAWLLRRPDGVDVVATQATDAVVNAAMAAGKASVAPRVLAAVDGWIVCERLRGPHLRSLEMSRPPLLKDLATTLARWHAVTVALPDASMLDSLRGYADEASGSLDADVTRAVAWADDALTELTRDVSHKVACHLDVAANVIATPQGLRLIDFDFAAMADPAQELGQLIWEAELDERGSAWLVDAYELASNAAVADWATWCLATGVTWTVWALSPRRPAMPRYARRSWERLRTHWAWPGRPFLWMKHPSCG
jgi:hypothetical protein